MEAYIPEQGDFVWLTFDPQSGHEQKGRRPALVASKYLFNRGTGMAIVCPVTNTNRKSPFHIAVSGTMELTGFIMVDQVKSVDFKSRKAMQIEKSDDALLSEVLSILDAVIY